MFLGGFQGDVLRGVPGLVPTSPVGVGPLNLASLSAEAGNVGF